MAACPYVMPVQDDAAIHTTTMVIGWPLVRFAQGQQHPSGKLPAPPGTTPLSAIAVTIPVPSVCPGVMDGCTGSLRHHDCSGAMR